MSGRDSDPGDDLLPTAGPRANTWQETPIERDEAISVGMLLVRHDPASAAVVRNEIAADLTTHSLTQDSVDDVLLVASELVGNAVVHAEPVADDSLDVGWDVEDGVVTVRVNDGSDEQPRRKDVSASALGGRGLAIVAAIAADWGVQSAAGGKQVWARVPVTSTR